MHTIFQYLCDVYVCLSLPAIECKAWSHVPFSSLYLAWLFATLPQPSTLCLILLHQKNWAFNKLNFDLSFFLTQIFRSVKNNLKIITRSGLDVEIAWSYCSVICRGSRLANNQRYIDIQQRVKENQSDWHISQRQNGRQVINDIFQKDSFRAGQSI